MAVPEHPWVIQALWVRMYGIRDTFSSLDVEALSFPHWGIDQSLPHHYRSWFEFCHTHREMYNLLFCTGMVAPLEQAASCWYQVVAHCYFSSSFDFPPSFTRSIITPPDLASPYSPGHVRYHLPASPYQTPPDRIFPYHIKPHLVRYFKSLPISPDRASE